MRDQNNGELNTVKCLEEWTVRVWQAVVSITRATAIVSEWGTRIFFHPSAYAQGFGAGGVQSHARSSAQGVVGRRCVTGQAEMADRGNLGRDQIVPWSRACSGLANFPLRLPALLPA